MTSSGAGRRFVYQWTDHGFFSELNNMLLAMLYCRLFNKEFVLSSRPATVFPHRGWQDFFRPFCRETDARLLSFLDSRPLPARKNVRDTIRGFDTSLRRRLLAWIVRPWWYSDVGTMAEHWDALRALRYRDTFALPLDGVTRDCSLQSALRCMERRVWHYNDVTEAAITKGVAPLMLPLRYAALHIRRGDMEVEPTSEERYVERLECATPLQDVYVATDDHRCVETIQRLRPRWRVSSLCPVRMRGYFPKDFDGQPPEERGRRTLLLLTETEIMKGAEVFVGTFSSGIGTYQGIARTDHTYGVDSEHWLFEGGA